MGFFLGVFFLAIIAGWFLQIPALAAPVYQIPQEKLQILIPSLTPTPTPKPLLKIKTPVFEILTSSSPTPTTVAPTLTPTPKPESATGTPVVTGTSEPAEAVGSGEIVPTSAVTLTTTQSPGAASSQFGIREAVFIGTIALLLVIIALQGRRPKIQE